MLKSFLKFGKLSRSFLIFVCPLGEKVPAWASHSWSRPTRPRTVGEYEYCPLQGSILQKSMVTATLAKWRWSWLVPSRLRVTRSAGAGGDGKVKFQVVAFLLPITPCAPLGRHSERRLGTSKGKGYKRRTRGLNGTLPLPTYPTPNHFSIWPLLYFSSVAVVTKCQCTMRNAPTLGTDH